MRTAKTLIRLGGCAGQFVSYLDANPEDRFSCDEAHIGFLHWHSYCIKMAKLRFCTISIMNAVLCGL